MTWEWHKMTWNDMRWHETTWNDIKRQEMSWNDLKCHEMPCNVMKCHNIAWNGMKWLEMMWSEMIFFFTAKYLTFSDIGGWQNAKKVPQRATECNEIPKKDTKCNEIPWNAIIWSFGENCSAVGGGWKSFFELTILNLYFRKKKLLQINSN